MDRGSFSKLLEACIHSLTVSRRGCQQSVPPAGLMSMPGRGPKRGRHANHGAARHAVHNRASLVNSLDTRSPGVGEFTIMPFGQLVASGRAVCMLGSMVER